MLTIRKCFGALVATIALLSLAVAAPASADTGDASFKSYLGCSTTIYDLTGQSGSSYGSFVNAPGVGAMNDRASSYTVT